MWSHLPRGSATAVSPDIGRQRRPLFPFMGEADSACSNVSGGCDEAAPGYHRMPTSRQSSLGRAHFNYRQEVLPKVRQLQWDPQINRVNEPSVTCDRLKAMAEAMWNPSEKPSRNFVLTLAAHFDLVAPLANESTPDYRPDLNSSRLLDEFIYK